MPRVTQAMKSKMKLEEIREAGGVMVVGGKTWFYIYKIQVSKDPREAWGMFFPSTGMDLHFTEGQAEAVVEFFKQNKLAE